MLLSPIVDQIKSITKAGGAQEFLKVAGAANFAGAKDDLKNPPAAYVLPLKDTAGANQIGGGGAILQPVKENFGVALAISNLRDATGMAAQLELERLRGLVIGKLLGFVPSADYEPCEYVGGSILLLSPEVMWWQLVFSTAYFERNF